jgi:hypothetical protein
VAFSLHQHSQRTVQATMHTQCGLFAGLMKIYTFDDDFGVSYTFDDSESQPTLLMILPTAMYQQHENTKDQ